MTSNFKEEVYRSDVYLAFVRSHKCMGVGKCLGDVQACHLENDGMSRKCDDRYTVPMCVKHHTEDHAGKSCLTKADKWKRACELILEFYV